MNKIITLRHFIITIIFYLFVVDVYSQQTNDYRERAIWTLGAYGGIGFSTLHKDKIDYFFYNTSSGDYLERRTLSRPYFSYGFGLFTDFYLDPNKTFGIGIDVSFTRMGFRDDLYDLTYRTYYITIAPRLVSWTEKNFFVSAGFYWGFLISFGKEANAEKFNKIDYGLLIDFGFIQQGEKTTTRTGFKIYLGLKNVFKKWNIPLSTNGEPKGMTFTVHFYLSFIFNLVN
jgi:hypothetical protein